MKAFKTTALRSRIMARIEHAALFASDPSDTPPIAIEVSADVARMASLSRPVLALSAKEAALLRAATSRTATLAADATRLVGADEMGRVYLFASDPVSEPAAGGDPPTT